MKTTCPISSPRTLGAISLLSLALCAHAQTRPPQAQAWIDVATYSGMGMPMGGMAGNPMAALGSLFGGGGAKNNFGNTQTGSAGRWVDVTLSTRANPSLGSLAATTLACRATPAADGTPRC